MKHLTSTLLVLAAVLGGTAAPAAGDGQIQQRDQLRDFSCVDPSVDGTAGDCLLLADQDRDRDRLKDQYCLDDDGTGDGSADGVKTRTRDRAGEDNGRGTTQRARK